MKTIQDIIKVMQHFANGGEVECRTARDWFNAPNPSWNWGSADYRIKQPVDPYAELKAAAKDPTKQVRVTGDDRWVDVGSHWSWDLPVSRYEIRDKPKPMKKVKLLAWFTGERLTWMSEDYSPLEHWNRAPSEDKEIEVEE